MVHFGDIPTEAKVAMLGVMVLLTVYLSTSLLDSVYDEHQVPLIRIEEETLDLMQYYANSTQNNAV